MNVLQLNKLWNLVCHRYISSQPTWQRRANKARFAHYLQANKKTSVKEVSPSCKHIKLCSATHK